MNGKSTANLVRRTLDGSQRRHKRFRTQSLLIDNPVVGRVVNVGQGGLAVESAEGLAVGETYLFKIRLGDKHLRLSGRIRWCRLTATEASGDREALPVYQAGVALLDDVSSKAWQEALRRTTEQPAHLIWHRASAKKSAENARRLEAARASSAPVVRLGSMARQASG